MLPKVTINIPTYNQEQYVGKAIESALSQDYSNLEIIIGDDSSQDGTYRVASEYLKHGNVKLVSNKERLGRVGNYRKMLHEHASGDWVVNLDGDDYYSDPSFISGGIKLLMENPDAVEYIAGATTYHEHSGKLENAKMNFKPEIIILHGTELLLQFRTLGQVAQHFAVLYNREKALQTNFYSLDALGTDTDSILRLALKGTVILHKKYVGVWRSHAVNASYTLSEDSVNKELKMFEHVATEAVHYLPKDKVEKWLQQQKTIKIKESLMMEYFRLPLSQAFRLYFKKVKFDFWNFKEFVKLILRTIRLR